MDNMHYLGDVWWREVLPMGCSLSPSDYLQWDSEEMDAWAGLTLYEMILHEIYYLEEMGVWMRMIYPDETGVRPDPQRSPSQLQPGWMSYFPQRQAQENENFVCCVRVRYWQDVKGFVSSTTQRWTWRALESWG